MGLRAVCILENDIFLAKDGHESTNFFSETYKKVHPIEFFNPYYLFFDQMWADSNGFFMKNLKKMA